jgi:hypothetical protein
MRLRHVDIHQHWLRQEVEARRIELKWIPTADMPADGLTKGLTKQKNDRFIEQLNLVDISTRLGPISAKDSKVATGSSGTAIAEPADPGGGVRRHVKPRHQWLRQLTLDNSSRYYAVAVLALVPV